MTYLFPGMDPWLEQPNLWADVHFRLIAALARRLSRELAPRYYVAVGTRTYITTSPAEASGIRYPDVSVVTTGSEAVLPVGTTVALSQPLTVQLPLPETVEENYLEVREAETGEVITAIEILSPTNKRPGLGREQYARKRLEILGTRTNLVEIDLLRDWPSMPFSGEVRLSHYRILIRRGDEGASARLYAFNVRDAMPVFPLPLQPDDREPVVNLKELLEEIYEEARYELRVNYQAPPSPPLSQEDSEWAAEIIKRAPVKN